MLFHDQFTGRCGNLSVYQGGDVFPPFASVRGSKTIDRVPHGAATQWLEQEDAVDPDPMPDDGQEYAACDHPRHIKCGTKWVLVKDMVADVTMKNGYRSTCKRCMAEDARIRRRKAEVRRVE